MRPITWALGGIVMCISLASPVAAKDAEDIFAKATDYTVRINVTITTPFIEDDIGSHSGAGFVVDKRRKWVATNAHVSGSSPSRLDLIFKDGTRVEGRRVYVDPYIDLAVIEMVGDVAEMREATLACNTNYSTGHPVGAYGHPWGLNFTGTQGVVSGSTAKWGPEHLQTDAPINGGNSGGPLISMRSGKVVGMNTSSMADDNDQNTNFAVPISQACRILDLTKEGRDPSPPNLETSFYEMIDENGPLIVGRTELSPDQMKLERGDEILSVNGTEVENASQMIHELRGNLNEVTIVVLRDGKEVAVLGHFQSRRNVLERQGVSFSGILFAENIFNDIAKLRPNQTVMIHSIESGSDADGEQLELFDFVSHVNGVPVQDLAHLRQVLDSLGGQKSVQVDLIRMQFDLATGTFFPPCETRNCMVRTCCDWRLA